MGQIPFQQDNKLSSHDLRFEALHAFFKNAEENNLEFTTSQILKEAYPENVNPHGTSTIRMYMRRDWSWFLRAAQTQKRPYTYRCEGIIKYPSAFFVLAHKPRHWQYFYHFRRAREDFQGRLKNENTHNFKEQLEDQKVIITEEQDPFEDVQIVPVPIEDDDEIVSGEDTFINEHSESDQCDTTYIQQKLPLIEIPLETSGMLTTHSSQEVPQTEDTQKSGQQTTKSNFSRMMLGILILCALVAAIIVLWPRLFNLAR